MPSKSRLRAAAFSAVLALPAASAGAEGLTPAERAEVGPLVREYLLANPEVLREAMVELQRREETAAAAKRLAVLSDRNGPLYNSKIQAVIGDPNAERTIIEFFDYNCGFCRKALPDMQRIVETRKDVRVILKDYPILSPESQQAAMVAVAVKMQLPPEKFWEFHVSLMSARGQVGREEAIEAARAVGADMARLEADMASEAVTEGLAETYEVAQTLGITGTPTYVVGEELIVGAVGVEDLTARLDQP